MINARRFADLGLSVKVPFHSAFDVIHIFEGRSKLFLLFLAVWAPERAIHLGAMIRGTFGECIQAGVMFVNTEVKGSAKCSHDDQGYEQPPHQGSFGTLHLFALGLPLSAFLRHDFLLKVDFGVPAPINFLYHDVQR